jgi:hypothetical protein
MAIIMFARIPIAANNNMKITFDNFIIDMFFWIFVKPLVGL